MRALNRERRMGMGSNAAGKPRAKETLAPVRPSKSSNRLTKSAENPEHQEDFERLLRKAVGSKVN